MNVRRIIPIALTFALLAAPFFVFRGELSLDRIAARIGAVDFSYLAIAIAFFIVGFAGAGLRYKFILDRAMRAEVSFVYLFLLSNFSYLCGYLAPVSVAAEILRMGFTKRYLAISYAQSLRYVVIDKMLGLCAVAACALIAVPIKLAHGVNRELIIAESLLVIAFFAAIPVGLRLGPRVIGRVPSLRGLAGVMDEDWRFVVKNFSTAGDLTRLLVYSLLAVGGFAFGTLYVAFALGFDVSAVLVLALSPTILLVQNAPFFYAGFGAREGIFLLALTNGAYADPNLVLGFSLTVGVVVFIACVPASILFFVYAGRSRPVAENTAGHAGKGRRNRA